MRHGFKILMLIVSTWASSSTPHESNTSNGSLKITSKLTCDCLRAIYTVDNVTFFIRSGLQDREDRNENGNVGLEEKIVSTIYLLRQDREYRKLSELSIPAQYIHERRVKGIEELIIASAVDLEQTLKKTPSLQFDQMISAYDGMIDELYSQTYHLTYNHARMSVFYHSSIIHAAKRLSQSVELDQVCPAYEAYQYRGFFACKQEYQEYYRIAMESPLFDCKRDEQCMKDRWSHLDGRSFTVRDQSKGRVKRSYLNLNETLKAFAKWKACGSTDCKVAGCENATFDLGWNILGSDWGCCGDYPDCCYLAENTCLLHDAICTCCTFKYFCVSEFCVPDPWCSGN